MRQALARKATGWLGNEASSVIKEMAEMARGDEEDDTNAAIMRPDGAPLRIVVDGANPIGGN